MSLAAIEVDVGEGARGDVASVESTSESSADDVWWSTWSLAPNCGLCQLSNRLCGPRVTAHLRVVATSRARATKAV